MDNATLTRTLELLVTRGGLTKDGSNYSSAEGHRCSFYLGQPGQAMVLKPIRLARLDDGLLVLERESDGSTLVVAVEAVHAVAVEPPATDTDRRAGFA